MAHTFFQPSKLINVILCALNYKSFKKYLLIYYILILKKKKRQLKKKYQPVIWIYQPKSNKSDVLMSRLDSIELVQVRKLFYLKSLSKDLNQIEPSKGSTQTN